MSTAPKKVILKSSDGEVFEVEEVVASKSQVIKHVIEGDCADSVIPVPNVTGKILAKVIEYCKKHVESPEPDDDRSSGEDFEFETWGELKTWGVFKIRDNFKSWGQRWDEFKTRDKLKTWEEQWDDFKTREELNTWDADFVKFDHTVLFDLILAANYLNIKGLLDLACWAVADMIKGKTPEDIRKTFNITTELTPEEEEEVRRENAWAFE